MEIKGKVHCFFEQSATFRDEFRKLGYESFDYDIQNSHASFTLIETREIQECRLKPNGNVAVKVSDDAQVNDNTEFID